MYSSYFVLYSYFAQEKSRFSLCPDSYFAHRQFRNRTVPGKNSYFARQSENSYFAQGQFRNCTDSYSAQNIYFCFNSNNTEAVIRRGTLTRLMKANANIIH